VERLDAVKTRLQAMVDAMNTIRPKLQAFYASLSDDQKARFNTKRRRRADDKGTFFSGVESRVASVPRTGSSRIDGPSENGAW
jgi:hypothetical protein